MDIIVIVGLVVGALAIVAGCLWPNEEVIGEYHIVDENEKEVIIYEVR